jgi:hypothetical protein
MTHDNLLLSLLKRVYGGFMILGRYDKMNEKCSFHIYLHRQSLQGLSLGNKPNDDCEFSGLLGEVLEIKVSEELLLEIRGTNGVIRLFLPQKFLTLLRNLPGKDGDVGNGDTGIKNGGDDS